MNPIGRFISTRCTSATCLASIRWPNVLRNMPNYAAATWTSHWTNCAADFRQQLQSDRIRLMKRVLTLLALFRALTCSTCSFLALSSGAGLHLVGRGERAAHTWLDHTQYLCGRLIAVGNGDLGLTSGSIQTATCFLYAGKTDAWDGFGRLLKLGRLRLALTPNPFLTGQPFRQEMVVHDGAVEITAGSPASK